MELIRRIAEICHVIEADPDEMEIAALCDEGKALLLYGALLEECDVTYQAVLDAVRQRGELACGRYRIKLRELTSSPP